MIIDSPRQRLIEKIVTTLFILTTVNLSVVFLVQGGYEFSVGPLTVHARYVLKSLLLCLAFALANAYVNGRRRGLSLSESFQSPIVLFLLSILMYNFNDNTLYS